MTYSRGMLFSSLCANICTFPQKLNLTHVMQEQKCLFSGSLKQTDVSSICQQVMRKLLPLRDITTYALLLRGKPGFYGKDNSIRVGDETIPYYEMGMEWTFGDSPVQPLCSSRISHSRLLWSMSHGVLRPSSDGDPVHTLG